MNKFKPRDVVQLKSGGPAMIVHNPNLRSYVDAKGNRYVNAVSCTWLDGTGKLQRAIFENETLKQYEPEPAKDVTPTVKEKKAKKPKKPK